MRVRLFSTAVSTPLRQRWATAGSSWLFCSVVSALLRQRWATAGSLWLFCSVVSVLLRQRWVTAGSSWLFSNAASALLRQRWVTAGSSWLFSNAASALLRQRWATAGSLWLFSSVVSALLRQRCATAVPERMVIPSPTGRQKAAWLAAAWPCSGHIGVVRVRWRWLPATVGSHAGTMCSLAVARTTSGSHDRRACAPDVAGPVSVCAWRRWAGVRVRLASPGQRSLCA
jgi:hypothetical protein